jgi:beta-glucosidase-like glycosyl hydrolase|eukprot:COSAG03_NODE_170_length_11252_cov_12.948893_11_plen_117_part_00
MKLLCQGLFDPPEGQPDYSDPSIVGSPKYHKLSLDASRQAMTLLSNRNSTLPLKPGGHLAVIGANAQTRTLMAGGTGGVRRTRGFVACPVGVLTGGRLLFLHVGPAERASCLQDRN